MRLWEWFWSVFKGIGTKNPGTTVPLVGISVSLPTGYTNMRNKDLLIQTQDAVWNGGEFMPKNGKTFCNLATQAVLHAFANYTMDGMLADQMMAYIRSSKDWLKKPIGDAQFLVNEGTILVAGLTAAELQQDDGHVCTLTPGDKADFSGHWNSVAPLCLSIGQVKICFRSRGINWAFQPVPNIYAWVPSL